MIEIDGSKGEGGGQILRTSIALSALLMRAVRVYHIRAGRPNPGLKRQHMAGIDLTAQLVQAETKGLEIGSEIIDFCPIKRNSGDFSYDIGTAGSISLVLQAVLPTAVLAPSEITFRLTGGTDVSWSPPIDYLKHVFLPTLKKLGPEVSITIEKRGHYPKGGGRVKINVKPCRVFKTLERIDFGEVKKIRGISHCVQLPKHVAERQASAAKKILLEHDFEDVDIELESYRKGDDPHLGPGSGIVIWAESEDGHRIGSDVLGARGKRAEDVGTEAAMHLLEELQTGKAIDSHLCDMIVPYLALADGKSLIGISEITSHLRTNIWVVQQFLKNEMNLADVMGGSGNLSFAGVGLTVSD